MKNVLLEKQYPQFSEKYFSVTKTLDLFSLIFIAKVGEKKPERGKKLTIRIALRSQALHFKRVSETSNFNELLTTDLTLTIGLETLSLIGQVHVVGFLAIFLETLFERIYFL